MSFEQVKTNILQRRNVKPEFQNGQIIADKDIHELLELANWAPTHGHTEPWRFVVFTGNGLQSFSTFHAELYKREMEANDKPPVKYEKILNRTHNVSHLIALGMKRGSNSKIPANEEHIAAGIAAYNIWLGAAAKGIACYWGSGGMTYSRDMSSYLGLDPETDQVLGFLYLGYTNDEPKAGRRLSPIENKTDWRSE